MSSIYPASVITDVITDVIVLSGSRSFRPLHQWHSDVQQVGGWIWGGGEGCYHSPLNFC